MVGLGFFEVLILFGLASLATIIVVVVMLARGGKNDDR